MSTHPLIAHTVLPGVNPLITHTVLPGVNPLITHTVLPGVNPPTDHTHTPSPPRAGPAEAITVRLQPHQLHLVSTAADRGLEITLPEVASLWRARWKASQFLNNSARLDDEWVLRF